MTHHGIKTVMFAFAPRVLISMKSFRHECILILRRCTDALIAFAILVLVYSSFEKIMRLRLESKETY